MNMDDFRAVRWEMEKVGREAQQVMQPLEVVGVLISMYPGIRLDIERRALSYALLVVLERSARSGS
jgi:hypothetical protein